MAYIELKVKYKDNEKEALESIKNDLSSKLPDYEIPKYVLIIDKIPYQNNKRAFKQLEEKGNEYVKSLR